MTSTRVLLLIAFIGCMPAAAFAAVVSFDDLPSGAAVPAGYEGLTWGTSSDDAAPGFTGYFKVSNDTGYATPHSAPNYVYNAYGPNNLWFSFASPVISFTGAWFARAGAEDGHQAERVRVRDDLGNVSAWLNLTVAPQFLNAGFLGSTTIYVERAGGVGGVGSFGNARWYTMDDVTYEPVPEPATMLLIGSGLVGLALRRRRG